MIGFAPKSINVNNNDNNKYGYYLHCSDGTLWDANIEEKEYINDGGIKDGSIVECLLDVKNGTISYKVDGKDYGVAFSNIRNNDGGSGNELHPVF